MGKQIEERINGYVQKSYLVQSFIPRTAKFSNLYLYCKHVEQPFSLHISLFLQFGVMYVLLIGLSYLLSLVYWARKKWLITQDLFMRYLAFGMPQVGWGPNNLVFTLFLANASTVSLHSNIYFLSVCMSFTYIYAWRKPKFNMQMLNAIISQTKYTHPLFPIFLSTHNYYGLLLLMKINIITHYQMIWVSIRTIVNVIFYA